MQKNLCKECCEKCLNHKEEIIDFNFDIDTKLSIEFISNILNENISSINNSESSIFNKTIKYVKDPNDSNYLVREKNSIFLELEKDKLKNYYFDLFLAIINDYNEYPNFIHIENILMIENFYN